MQDAVLSAGESPKLRSVLVVAFYEPETGVVRYTHTAYLAEGAHSALDGPIEAARRVAHQLGLHLDRLEVATSSALPEGHQLHAIDPRTREFLSRPAKDRRKAERSHSESLEKPSPDPGRQPGRKPGP